MDLKNAPVYTFNYCNKLDGEHEIRIIIPGKKAFEDKKFALQSTIQKQDVRIEVIKSKGGKAEALSHGEVIEELYKLIDGDAERYEAWRMFLKILYENVNLTENSYFLKIVGTWGSDIASLASFIRWCGAQEMINYPTGWGRDLNFSRYFEGALAGYTKNKDFKNKVIERSENTGYPDLLYQDINITIPKKGIVNIDIYNGCFLTRKRIVKLDESYYK